MKVNENLSLLSIPEKSEINLIGEAPTYIRITICEQRKEISLGSRIKPEDWNYDYESLKTGAKDWQKINSQIVAARAKLENHYLLLQAQFTYVTANMLKKAYKGRPVT